MPLFFAATLAALRRSALYGAVSRKENRPLRISNSMQPVSGSAPDCGLSARFIRTLGIYTKPIFPVRTIEVAGVTVLMLGAAVLVPVKSGLALHEHFKCAAFTAHKVHSGCASFLDLDRKKTPQTSFKICGVGVCEKGCCLAVTSLLSLGYSIFELTCLPTALKNVGFTGFLLVFLC